MFLTSKFITLIFFWSCCLYHHKQYYYYFCNTYNGINILTFFLPVILRKFFDLMPPRVPEFWESMHKQHELFGFIAFLHIMQFHILKENHAFHLCVYIQEIVRLRLCASDKFSRPNLSAYVHTGTLTRPRSSRKKFRSNGRCCFCFYKNCKLGNHFATL